ncbi:MAG: co-chaperone YbbN [gamma proteobacterium symbiont of Bathyaustriella thionipta]|nr:co-chaperone YbbN [gamma proteobacterium symbiont of Bathyaustriella thionipta]MCU7950819.1 co-chaperone YbbN [gamma proteobacterium symbiont of Bathyaustriella thionipta]MCU7952396.1 co-chaperone YbbN [gamma proteobacterium symbiont of Bathyaustriella thionipta]MCU7957331.1 co-chaperone YbbN [gamma proteobacterium symbiont of Bathyaustriella thionipta]MCU7968423.1 co-chaperone YbbN [gamma proteobacterium symbiont of Bathyaustriella thionipta]
MSDFPFVVDIQDSAHFEQQVIELSKQQPILVDFWADWCQPCKVLIPLLSKLSEDYKGAFILAKVNADEQQELVAAAGVRNLPTVKLYKDGIVVDEFMGAKTESELRQFLDAHIENETSSKIKEALNFSDNGNYDQATEILKALNQVDPSNNEVYVAIAKVYLQSGDIENCEAVLKALPANIQLSDEVKKIQDELAFVKVTSNAPDVSEALIQLENDPDNHEIRVQLANQYIVSHQYEQALDALLYVLKQDINFQDGEAKAAMLKVFEILGPQEALTRSYRTKLATLLY